MTSSVPPLYQELLESSLGCVPENPLPDTEDNLVFLLAPSNAGWMGLEGHTLTGSGT